MTFSTHLQTFAGRRVVAVPESGPLPDLGEPVAWHLSTWHYEADDEDDVVSPRFVEALDRLVGASGPAIESLVVGAWGYAAFHPAPIDALREAAPRLPNLRSLFLGDMTSEECEVSWMKVGDVSRVLAACPRLELFAARGGEEFTFSPVKHDTLRALVVQSGGLSGDFVTAVLNSSLPALTDLELWLGTETYGGTTTVEHVAPLLSGELFPGLRRLALRNAEIADELAAALASAPVVARLERLDLSLGTLTDAGAEALLSGRSLTHLAELDLHHHFLSEEVAASLPARLPGVRVDVSEPQEPDVDDDEIYRYTAVSE
nr:STM4015 family protein [uncultured Actinoplanes sp.]